MSLTTKLRAIFNVGLLYLVTAGFVVVVLVNSSSSQPVQAITFKTNEVASVVDAQVPSSPAAVRYGKPASLSIASLNLDLQVVDGNYDAKTQAWSLSPRSAHFALLSSLPNDKQGTTFIYGHNNVHVFGTLWRIKPGGELVIKTSNNLVFRYAYNGQKTVAPNDTSFLNNLSDKPQLIVQTCTGAWNEKRRLYFFNLASVEHVSQPTN